MSKEPTARAISLVLRKAGCLKATRTRTEAVDGYQVDQSSSPGEVVVGHRRHRPGGYEEILRMLRRYQAAITYAGYSAEYEDQSGQVIVRAGGG